MAVSALAGISVIAVGALGDMLDEGRRARSVQRFAEKCNEVLIDLLNVETGHRGYVIVGLDDYLRPHLEGLGRLEAHMAELRAFPAQDPETPARLARTESLIAARAASSRKAVELRRTAGFDAARDELVAGVGKTLMDSARAALNALADGEMAHLARIDARREASQRRTVLAVAALSLGAIAFLAYLDRAVQREMRERQAAEERVLDLNEELRGNAAALEAEIRERRAVEEKLQQRNSELRDFAYSVSHDLKAPLRGIVGYSQELLRKHAGALPERGRLCASQIVTASRNLDALIDDLLAYSRLDAEEPAAAPVDVRALVRSILDDRAHTIAENGVEAQVAVPPLVERIWERGVRQILANLIDNAIKYARDSKPPRLGVEAARETDALRFSVSDNGIGFDMRYHDRMFGLFNRLVRPDEFEGTGAGLAIALKLAKKMGGELHGESAPGAGATFFLTIPVAFGKSASEAA